MKSTTNYTDEPIKIGKLVNVLPSPSQLARMSRTERATITLKKETLDFFRKEGKKEGVAWNALIRNVLDEYVRRVKPD